MDDRFDRRPLRLTPLSPIHCGAGEVFDWTTCILDKANGQVIAFDSSTLDLPPAAAKQLGSLGDEALGRGIDPVEFIRHAQQFFKKEMGAVRRARGVSYAMLPRILDRLDELTGLSAARKDREAIQGLEIARAVADRRTGFPIVFGSGVKGALRTSWGYCHSPRTGEPEGKFDRDPFSQVSAEDFLVASPVRTSVVVARNVKRTPPGEGPSIQVEAIVPNTAVAFLGAVRVRRRGRSADQDTPWLGLDTLLQDAQHFHTTHWKELRPAFRQHAENWWFETMDELVSGLGRPQDACLVRVGKLCAAESKTIENREIKVRISRKETQTRKSGTTIWLAGDEKASKGLPFGWALLEPLDSESRGARLVEAFQSRAPWRDLKIEVEPTSVGAPVVHAAPSTAASGPAGAMISDLRSKLQKGQLSEDFLKSAIREASAFPLAEERQAVRAWIEANYKAVVRPAYRQKNFEALLAKLK